MIAGVALDFLNKALELAEIASRIDEVPVGAVVVKDGIVIGEGHNLRESSHDPTAHAEIIAIRAASQRLGDWRLEDCELYVTLEPCVMCLGAIQNSRIVKVVYAAKDPKGGALSLGYTLHEDQRTNHRFQLEYRPKVECENILREFFKKKR